LPLWEQFKKASDQPQLIVVASFSGQEEKEEAVRSLLKARGINGTKPPPSISF
jgi:hypothetical protein